MQIRCSWNDPQTNKRYEPILNLPVAFGRDLYTMQQRKPGIFPRMVINHNAISSYHCLIDIENNQLVVIDQNSSNGTFVNNIRQQKAGLNDGDILKIGGVEIAINIMANPTPKQVKINFYNANNQKQNRILLPPIALGKDAMTLLEEKTKPNSSIAS
ncbi:MAG TPA: FHA domain-containing protein, partial [Allocoleopsis sp.]